jgi:hypothetical protein
MPLKLKDAKKAGQYTIAPTGNHPARCYAIIDLGTHTEDGNYGVQTNRKLRFSWELPDEVHTFEEGKGPQPFAVHRTVNFVINPRSNFQKMLESWRGKAFTEAELENFEIKKVLGAPCIITVIHVQRGDKTFANVDAVTPLPSKWKTVMSGPVNAPVYYEIDMGKNEIYKALPEWIRLQIDKCNEWADRKPDVGEAPPVGEEDPFQPTDAEDKDGGEDSNRPF